MATINAYTFAPRKVDVYAEIWDSKKKKVTPIQSIDMLHLHEVLDSMANAVEAGVVDTLAWPQQFFAKKTAFLEFIDRLAEYDDCFRITDQWWQALAALAGVSDEEGFISTQDMAAELFTAAEKDGLLENSCSQVHRRAVRRGPVPVCKSRLCPWQSWTQLYAE